MGAVGFTCWLIKAAIACYWAATANTRTDMRDDPSYIGWDAPKFVVRCVATAFLMGLFMQVNARAFPRKNPNKAVNYLLVPAVMLAIFSVFWESLIDQYLGLDKILRFVMMWGDECMYTPFLHKGQIFGLKLMFKHLIIEMHKLQGKSYSSQVFIRLFFKYSWKKCS